MSEMHLRQPAFTYNACGPFRKNKERIQKFKETGDSWCIYQNELDKAYFQHDMAYGCFDKETSGGAATLAWSETLAKQNKCAIKNENV